MKKVKPKTVETDLGFERFVKTAGIKLDPVLMVLRAHLLAEYYIDQIIALEIRRGDLIVDRGFSFFQKLIILRALDLASNNLLDSLEALNKLRNRCSHDMEYSISEADIDRLGLPQGRDYFELKEEFCTNGQRKALLHLTLIGIIAPLDNLVSHIKRDHKGINAGNSHAKNVKIKSAKGRSS